MKYVLTIYDKVSKTYTDPFTANNTDDSRRAFMHYIARGLQTNSAFPYNDLELYHVGFFNEDGTVDKKPGEKEMLADGLLAYENLTKIAYLGKTDQNHIAEPSEYIKMQMTANGKRL
jgi:hypothetical protein